MPVGIYKRTLKTRKILSLAAKRRVAIYGIPFLGKTHTLETKEKLRQAKLGKKQSKETILKRAIKLRGIPRTVEWRRKVSEAQRGDKAWNWKGGKESINKRIHHSVEYKLWRESVFKRDDYTCRHCKTRGGKGNHVNLHPHHIHGFAHYPEKRFELDNGATLCVPCHREFHRLYGEGKSHYKYFNSWEQI